VTPFCVAVDFDGVLHDVENRVAGYRMGRPVEGAIDAMNHLRDEGAHIVVFTVRAGAPDQGKHVRDWLRHFSVPYDEVTNVKPHADAYVDDKGVTFESWDQALNELHAIKWAKERG
jgi:hypothetical protein